MEKQMLFENLKEYMLRSSVIFTLREAEEIGKEEAYSKLYKVWDEYFDSAKKIFGDKDN